MKIIKDLYFCRANNKRQLKKPKGKKENKKIKQNVCKIRH